MTRNTSNEHINIAIKNDHWQIAAEGKSGWRLTLQYNQRKMLLYLHPDASLTTAAFIANPAAPAIAHGRSQQLKPMGQLQMLNLSQEVLWQELCKPEHPLKVDNDIIRFYAGFIANKYNTQHLYVYASIQYHASTEDKLKKYLEDFYTVLQNIWFTKPAPAVVLPSFFTAANDATTSAQRLSGYRLHRMESYDSGSYSGGGGYSIEEIIDLFADQTCRYHYTSIVSGGSLGGFSPGGGFTEEKSAGTWSISGGTLFASLNNGNRKAWNISFRGAEVWLDNNKYYREKL